MPESDLFIKNCADELTTAVRSLAPQIRASAGEIEQARRLPQALITAMKEAGVFRMAMPAAWGGPELEPLAQMEIIEEISAADASVGWCAAIGLSGGYFSAYLDQDVAREMYADLDSISGYVIRPTGRAVAAPGGYKVSGRWSLGSCCQDSAWMASGCIVYDGESPRCDSAGHPTMLVCFLPAGSFSILDTWRSTGLRGTGSHDYLASDVFVPSEHAFNLLTSPIVRDGPLYQMRLMFLSLHAGVVLGLARSAIGTLQDLAGEKQTMFGTRLCDESYVQSSVGHAQAVIGAARAYMGDVINDLWSALISGNEPSPRQRTDFRLAIVHAHDASKKAVDMMYAAGGGSSIHAASPLDRLLRDVHTAAQHAVGSPRTYESAGRFLLGLDPGDPTF